MVTRVKRIAIVLLTALIAAGSAFAQPARTLVVMPQTLEGALGRPKVQVQLWDGDRVVTGEPEFSALGLGDILPQQGPAESFAAYLDTGASAVVISAGTAGRFGIRTEPEAVYHEAGLHGETPMHVSESYTLALVGHNAGRDDAAAPGQALRLQINPKPAQGLMALMGEINVVGMPVIQQYIIEIDPLAAAGGNAQLEGMLDELNEDLNLGVDLSVLAMAQTLLGGGSAARLHSPDQPVEGYDYAIPLRMVDFNRHQNPADRGPMPTVAPNPMVVNVRTETVHGVFTGEWLLDTGAAASIISTRHAEALGLIDDQGRYTRPQDFTLPIGGIGGKISNPPGFIIDRLILPAHEADLEYRNVRVLVLDIGTELDDGTQITLDGVLGMNLFLPSVSGLATGFPTDATEPPLRRIWIDGPRAHLLLEAQPPKP